MKYWEKNNYIRNVLSLCNYFDIKYIFIFILKIMFFKLKFFKSILRKIDFLRYE